LRRTENKGGNSGREERRGRVSSVIAHLVRVAETEVHDLHDPTVRGGLQQQVLHKDKDISNREGLKHKLYMT
jgi:hypothetical protein